MKRVVLWLLSTLSVLVLLFGYHTSTSGPSATGNPPALISAVGQGGAAGGGKAGSGSSGGSSGSGGSGGSAAQSKPTTVTGSVAQTQWGPVQVQIAVSGGQITDVAVPQYPNGNGTDIQIARYALPILVKETLDKQSANIDMVSGATYTSTGYLQSLQSAIDQAGL